MKEKISIILFFVGLIIISGSLYYRKCLKGFGISHARNSIETPLKYYIPKSDKPQLIIKQENKINVFKEVMEYIKEIIGSLSSIIGFILFILERRKNKTV